MARLGRAQAFGPFQFGAIAASANDLAATGVLSITGAAAINASGALLGAGTLSITGAADLDATGSLAAAGVLSITGAADLDALGQLLAAGSLSITGAADLDAIGSLLAAGALSISGAAAISGNANDIVAAGSLSITGSALLTAIGELAAAGSIAITGSAALAQPASPAQDQAFSGGLLYAFEREQARRRKRRRELEEAEEEAQKLKDAVDREIAELLQEQERKAEFEQNIARLKRIVGEFADKEAEVAMSGRVRTALARAQTQESVSAFLALQRELDRQFEEEEFAILMILAND